MSTMTRPLDSASAARRFLRWVKTGFFSTPASALITIVVSYWLAGVLPRLYDWLVASSVLGPSTFAACVQSGGACWAFLYDKYRLILFGTYPYDDQWRAALAVGLFVAMVVVTCIPLLWSAPRARRALLVAWTIAFALIVWLMWGGFAGLARVEVRTWAGLPLTMMLASVGVVVAFGFSILLALGRQSDMPVIRWLSIAYIELMRGVPLISLLFMASVMFPLLVPPDVNVDKLLRAQIAFIMFFAAYMAEAIRGGLQAIPPGQYAAAEAIGLTYWQSRRRIVLPQALRLVIPSLVNIFIAAFKDTSLVIVISMFDLLGTANAAKADPKWWGIYQILPVHRGHLPRVLRRHVALQPISGSPPGGVARP